MPAHRNVTFQRVGAIAGGSIAALALRDNRLFVGATGRIDVVDVGDATHMRRTAALEMPGEVRGLASAGDVLVAALGTAGLALVDVSSPDAPKVTATMRLPGSAESVATIGDLAYVADGPLGLVVVDISSPPSPNVVGTIDHVMARGISVGKGKALLAAGAAGVIQLDIADPRRPVAAAPIAVNGYTLGATFVGQMIAAAAAWGGLALIDPSASPPRTTMVPLPSWAMGVAPGDSDSLFVADADAGVRVFDVTTGVARGGFDTQGGHIGAVAVGPTTAFLADAYGGVRAISTRGVPRELGSLDAIAQADGISVIGNVAYVGASRGGIRAIDISDPAQPRELASLPTALPVTAVQATADGLLATTQPDGVLWIDIGDPRSPKASPSHTIRAEITAAPFGDRGGRLHQAQGGAVRSGVVRGSTVFWATELGLQIVDERRGDVCAMSQLLGAPDPIGSDGSTGGVDVSGTIAYIGESPATAGTGGLFAIDVSNPRAPRVIGALGAQAGGAGFNSVMSAGDRVYGINIDSFSVIDASEPTSLRLVGRAPLPSDPFVGVTWLQSMDTMGGLVLVADGSSGLLAYDVSDARRPRLAGRYALPGSALSVVVRDDVILVGTTAGLLLLRADVAVAATGGGGRALAAPLGAACTVNTDAPNGPGSLLQCADSAGPKGAITFDTAVFNESTPRTIYLERELVIHYDGLSVDATGSGVILDGSRHAPLFAGVSVRANGATIRGLTIQNFEHGIFIEGNDTAVGGPDQRSGNTVRGSHFADIVIHGYDRNVIDSNRIGDANAPGPLIDSVVIDDGSAHNVVRRNAIAGSVFVTDTGSSYNELVGNTIGIVGRTGHDGNPIVVAVSQPFNRIGGAGEGNTINAMLTISAPDVFVLGNTIIPSGRSPGLEILSAARLTIGGLTSAESNLVRGGAGQTAVRMHEGPASCVIAGNAFAGSLPLVIESGSFNVFVANDITGGPVVLGPDSRGNRFYGTTPHGRSFADRGSENVVFP